MSEIATQVPPKIPHELVTSQLDPEDWAHAYFTAYLGPIGRGTISNSLKHAGVSKDTYRARMLDDHVFRTLHEEANDIWIDILEQELHTRVLDGTQRAVYQRGHLVGYVREVDNKLLTWYLERLRPDKYHLATKFELTSKQSEGAFKFEMGERPLNPPAQLEPGDSPDET